jgi:protocatechuate 3,4-dioxygenase beta subunit
MDNDDGQVGRLLSRREVLALIGGTSIALVIAGCSSDSTPAATATSARTPTRAASATSAVTPSASSTAGVGAAAPSCIVRPAETEGPYFVDEKINRSDIRSDPSDGTIRPGALLALTFNVSSVGSGGGCTPLEGATIDVWHCDALGVYSDASDPGFTTTGKKFLRGYQVTDAAGQAKFTTIYPGWYQGRAVHIHFKIRSAASGGSATEFTSQLYFDDSLTDRVHAQAPYAQKGQRTLRNAGDSIFQGGGDQLTLDVTQSDGGYAATFDIGLQA